VLFAVIRVGPEWSRESTHRKARQER